MIDIEPVTSGHNQHALVDAMTLAQTFLSSNQKLPESCRRVRLLISIYLVAKLMELKIIICPRVNLAIRDAQCPGGWR
jgi:hypothetical protein